MKDQDVVLIMLFVVIGLAAVNLLGGARFSRLEGFASPEKEGVQPIEERSKLSPDLSEEGPAHIIKDVLEITRPYNNFGTLTQQKCYEQDGNRLPEKLGDYSQRTNNYVHTYPDSCDAPFKELVGSFYAPREGSIGAPIPVGSTAPASTECRYGQA
jgi:hypothetical protein